MGRFRFLLAVLVALSHCGLDLFGFNPGNVAVISFYILSGYVMTLLVRRHYNAMDKIRYFYIDRAARLFPHYLFYCAIMLALWFTPTIRTAWLAEVTPGKLLLNLLIVPLNFHAPEFLALDRSTLIPQAWSLGLEIIFYALVPFLLLRCGPAMLSLVAAGSFAIYTLAVFGVIDTLNFGYELIPGTLFIFIIGISLAENTRAAHLRIAVCLCATAILAGVVLYSGYGLFDIRPNKEVLLGILLGTASVAALTQCRQSAFDDAIGNVSYGLFLNHTIVISLAQANFAIEQFDLQQALAVVAIGTVAAILSNHLVEKPVIEWRRKIRYRTGAAQRSMDLTWIPAPRPGIFLGLFRRAVAQ